MTDDQLAAVIEKSVERGVTRAFAKAGIDIHNDWPHVQQDMAFLRQMRSGTQRIRIAVITSVILTLVSGLLYLLWDGLKNLLR